MEFEHEDIWGDPVLDDCIESTLTERYQQSDSTRADPQNPFHTLMSNAICMLSMLEST